MDWAGGCWSEARGKSHLDGAAGTVHLLELSECTCVMQSLQSTNHLLACEREAH